MSDSAFDHNVDEEEELNVSPSEFLIWCKQQGHDTSVGIIALEVEFWDDYVQDRKEVRCREDRTEVRIPELGY